MASEIRVDKINSLSGVGTVTLSPTGVDIAGITTAATLRATTGIVTSLTSGSLTSLGAVSGTTGTFTSSLTINTTTDQMLNLNSTDNGGTYIGYQRSGTRTAYLGHGGTGSTFTLRNEIELKVADQQAIKFTTTSSPPVIPRVNPSEALVPVVVLVNCICAFALDAVCI